MRSIPCIRTSFALFLGLSACLSCEKALQLAPQLEASQYRIKVFNGGSPTFTINFTYNAWGDPITGNRPEGPATGSPNLLFQYDERHRLSSYSGVYSNGVQGEFRHQYGYVDDRSQNITYDTNYIFPEHVSGPVGGYFNKVTYTYSYDAENRIIKLMSYDSLDRIARTESYSYDQQGDLVGYQHDDKLNFNLTNKVFAFLNISYSINNPFQAQAYNAIGLPTEVSLTGESNPLSFLDIEPPTMQIEYTHL